MIKKTLLTVTAAGAFASTILGGTTSALAGPIFAPPDLLAKSQLAQKTPT